MGWQSKIKTMANLGLLLTLIPAFAKADSNGIRSHKLRSAAVCGVSIDSSHELMITDLSVVNDARTAPGGPWNFGTLMKHMAPTEASAPAFVAQWIKQWPEITSVNGFAVDQRSNTSLLNVWPKDGLGNLDLDKSPFRLLAVVFRPDLTGPGSAGEGRFVFGLTTPGGPAQFFVIFEYGLPLNPNQNIDRAFWANQWHHLSSLPFGDNYNQSLQAITDRFSSRGAFPSRPNGSSLDQLRTNELFLASPWQLRQFNLDSSDGQLKTSPTAQNPDVSFNGARKDELIQFLVDNASAVNDNSFKIPSTMLGGKSDSAAPDNDWLPELKNDPDPKKVKLRSQFALQTCNGCHSSETNTAFVQITNRDAAQEAQLSAFVKQDLLIRAKLLKSLVDPANCGREAVGIGIRNF